MWEMETSIKIIILLSKQCYQIYFFFSLVPSFKTCLAIFLFGEELTFGLCKYQSVARLYSGGKRVELSTVMVS